MLMESIAPYDNFRLSESDVDDGELEAARGDDVLTLEDQNEIMGVLKPFVDSGNFSIEELRKHEERIKRAKILEKLKSEGNWKGQEIVLGDNYLVDSFFALADSDEDLSENKSDSDDKGRPTLRYDAPTTTHPSFFSTDVVSREDLDRLSKESPETFGKILGRQFYELKGVMEQYSEFSKEIGSNGPGYTDFEIDNDLSYLSVLKKKLYFDLEGSEKDSVKFEHSIVKGLAVGNWLFDHGRDFFDVGKIKHTTEYDDFINHTDYYCPMRVFGKQVVVGFDATINSRESAMLLKLDQGTSSQGIPPFGFNYIKYCHIDEAPELRFEEEKDLKKVPLYKISLDFDERIGFGKLNEQFSSVRADGKKAISYFRQVGNGKIYDEDELLRFEDLIQSSDSYEDEEINNFHVAHNKMNRLKDLTTSFFVLSEIHEQNLLILEKNEKSKTSKFKTRNDLSSSDVDSVKKIDAAIYRSLNTCMRLLARFNGEDELIDMESEKLYSIMKTCAGVQIDNDSDLPSFEHNFGLRLFSENAPVDNKCYVNMMNCVDAERNDIVYREIVRREDGGVAIVAHRYKKQLEETDSEKDLARDIFGSMALDSYLDNFEELFQIAKETNSVKAFIERLGKDDSADNYGRTKIGLMRYADNDGVEHFRTIDTIGATNHDDIILTLFESEKDRNKYFAGKNKDYAANCLSDEYFNNDDAVRRLLDWGVSEGRICYVFSSRFGLSDMDAKQRVSLLKQKK